MFTSCLILKFKYENLPCSNFFIWVIIFDLGALIFWCKSWKKKWCHSRALLCSRVYISLIQNYQTVYCHGLLFEYWNILSVGQHPEIPEQFVCYWSLRIFMLSQGNMYGSWIFKSTCGVHVVSYHIISNTSICVLNICIEYDVGFVNWGDSKMKIRKYSTSMYTSILTRSIQNYISLIFCHF